MIVGVKPLQDPKNVHGRDLLIKGRAPRHGEIMRMPHLAQTMRVTNVIICFTAIGNIL